MRRHCCKTSKVGDHRCRKCRMRVENLEVRRNARVVIFQALSPLGLVTAISVLRSDLNAQWSWAFCKSSYYSEEDLGNSIREVLGRT